MPESTRAANYNCVFEGKRLLGVPPPAPGVLWDGDAGEGSDLPRFPYFFCFFASSVAARAAGLASAGGSTIGGPNGSVGRVG